MTRAAAKYQAMSGRFCLIASPEDVALHFAADMSEGFPPRYNIAPTQPVLLIEPALRRFNQLKGSNRPDRHASLARWGLIPGWVKDVASFPLIVSARAEGVSQKASYRAAMRHRRVLIPASGFYEWQRRGQARPQPYLMRRESGKLLALAGLKETFLSADGSEIDTLCLISTESAGAAAEVDERMPLVIEEKNFERWLDCLSCGPSSVADLLKCPAGLGLEARAISELVNKVTNSGPELHNPRNLNDAGNAPATNKSEVAPDSSQLKLF